MFVCLSEFYRTNCDDWLLITWEMSWEKLGLLLMKIALWPVKGYLNRIIVEWIMIMLRIFDNFFYLRSISIS